MPPSFVRQFRMWSAALLAALILQWPLMPMPAGADERGDFRAAVDAAASQYRAAMNTLEISGREQTAAEVRRFRESWQAIVDRYGAHPPVASSPEDDYAGLFMQIDARIVGALIVIDIGSREAARDALTPIGDTLSALSNGAAPPK
jgi:hypothetical protein